MLKLWKRIQNTVLFQITRISSGYQFDSLLRTHIARRAKLRKIQRQIKFCPCHLSLK